MLLLLLLLLKEGRRRRGGQHKQGLLLLLLLCGAGGQQRLDLWKSVDGAADELRGALHATPAAAAILDPLYEVVQVVHALEEKYPKLRLR